MGFCLPSHPLPTRPAGPTALATHSKVHTKGNCTGEAGPVQCLGKGFHGNTDITRSAGCRAGPEWRRLGVHAAAPHSTIPFGWAQLGWAFPVHPGPYVMGFQTQPLSYLTR